MSEKTQKKQSKRRETGCPVAFSLDVFGDRWTLLIIREMMIAGKNTYSDFLEAEEAIATNILIDRLKLLEAEGIVKKERDPENRRSFIYHLTEKGEDLAPILVEMITWAGKYDQRDIAQKQMVKLANANKAGFEEKLRDKAPVTG